jgi:hypothetical protein
MTGFDSKQKMAADKLREPEREALKLALEALEEAHYKIEHKQNAAKREQAITAIREALAQPAQEQRPWVGLTDKESIDIIKKDDNYKYPIKLLQAVMDALKEKNA